MMQGFITVMDEEELEAEYHQIKFYEKFGFPPGVPDHVLIMWAQAAMHWEQIHGKPKSELH